MFSELEQISKPHMEISQISRLYIGKCLEKEIIKVSRNVDH